MSSSSESSSCISVPTYQTYGLENGSTNEQVKANMNKTLDAHTKMLQTYKGGKCIVPPASCSRTAPTFPPANGVEVSPTTTTTVSNAASKLNLQLQSNKISLGSTDWSDTSSASSSGSSSASSSGSSSASSSGSSSASSSQGGGKKRKRRRGSKSRKRRRGGKSKKIKRGGKSRRRRGKSRKIKCGGKSRKAKGGKYLKWGCFS